jgi:TRAP-type C4-dicarboxylate transport system substrate-binding protein
MKMCLFYLVFAMLLLPAGGAGAQQIKLKANLQAPLFTTYGKSMTRFKQEVERRTNNAITIEIFDKAQLFAEEQVVGAVSSGAVDIGTAATQSFTDGAPAVGIIDLPFLFNFRALVEAAASATSEVRTLIDGEILAKLGVRVLWWQPLGDTVFHSVRRDVADPGRLKDQRVAVASESVGGFVRRCGGLPTALSAQKFHDAIKDGTLDMAMVSLSGLQSLRLSMVTDTVTYTAHAPIEFLLIINEKVASALERQIREQLSKFEAEIRQLASDKGIRIQALTPDQVAEWRACSADVVVDYMEKNGDLARRLMAAYSKLRTSPCCAEGPGGGAFMRR